MYSNLIKEQQNMSVTQENKIQYHETTDEFISIDINKVLKDVEYFNELVNVWTMPKPIDINYGKLLGDIKYRGFNVGE